MDQATSRSLVVAPSGPASSGCAGGAVRLALLALAPPAQFHTGPVVRAGHEAQALVEAALAAGAEELDLEHAHLLAPRDQPPHDLSPDTVAAHLRHNDHVHDQGVQDPVGEHEAGAHDLAATTCADRVPGMG